MRHHLALAALLLGIGLTTIPTAPVRADDSVKVQNVEAAVKYFKKYAKKAKDPQRYGDLVMQLQAEDHPLAAEAIGKELRREKDEEQQLILSFALGEFDRNPEARQKAGEELVESLTKKDYETEVQDNIVTAIGKLKFKPAVPLLCERVEKGGDPWLLVTTVRALGRIGDLRALPTLLGLWERHPVGYSWETGEVTVDTGAPGDKDQKAAEAAWQEKYGAAGLGKGGKPFLLKAYIQELAEAVKRITGDEKVSDPTLLRTWMEENRELLAEAGVEIPEYKGPRKKKKDD